MIIDHLGIGVADYARAKKFYGEALAPLGITLVMEIEEAQACGFGKGAKPDFWISAGGKSTSPTHIAFVAANRAEVRAFHEAALRAGARDHGEPGLRPQYHPNYYGAFVLDLDGNNVEAVCHKPE